MSRWTNFFQWLESLIARFFGPSPPHVLGVRYLRTDHSMLIFAVDLALDPSVAQLRADVTSAGSTVTVPLVLSNAGDYEFPVSPDPKAKIAVKGADAAGVWGQPSAPTEFNAVAPIPVDNGPPAPIIKGVRYLRTVPDVPPAPVPAPVPNPAT